MDTVLAELSIQHIDGLPLEPAQLDSQPYVAGMMAVFCNGFAPVGSTGLCLRPLAFSKVTQSAHGSPFIAL